jgi:hypothetical protein
MATYTLISSNVLASSAASVTFSAIPATYTDLVLRVSARSDGAALVQDNLWLTFNGTGSGYSGTNLQGNGSAASSNNNSAASILRIYNAANANGATANTFGNAEVYIPNYLVSQYKPVSGFGVAETNATGGYISATAGLSSNNAAITSIAIAMGNGSNWLSTSSFYLYGISNA